MAAELRAAVESSDWPVARSIAHKLKGTAANAGARALERQVVELDWELKHRRGRGLWAVEEKLRRAVQHCRRAPRAADAPRVLR